MNKSSGTTFISVLIFVVSLLLPEGSFRFFMMQAGLFAISGAVTNWLAIYMLFEKIPFLYGSGVIPSRFDEFKDELRHLVMETFFNEENINRYLRDEELFHLKDLQLDSIVHGFDYDAVFDGLVRLVLQSKIGGMLEMFGGAQSVEPLREGLVRIIQEKIAEVVEDPEIIERLNQKLKENIPEHAASGILIPQITKLVEARLKELTPQMVKEIVSHVIRKHLGWLVVWGGVFGALIGIVTALLQFYKVI